MSRRGWLIGGAAAVVAGAAVGLVLVGGGRPGAEPRARVSRVPGHALRIVGVTARPLSVVVGQQVDLAVEVERGSADHGALTYLWGVPAGTLDRADAAEVHWTAPGKPGRREILVGVQDGATRVRGKVMVEVRLPSPKEVADLAGMMRAAGEREREAARTRQLATDEQRLSELEALAAKHDDISDLLRAQQALEDEAGLLEELGRYEDADKVYERLLGNMLPGASKYAKYEAGAGDVAFMLGDEDRALAAWKAGGAYTQGMSQYYRGEVLERRGDREGAIAAYTQAGDGMHWFADPVYRQALLMLDDGKDPKDVASLLVDASSRLDRDRMMARFDDDPETAVLGRLLRDTGRVRDLVAQQPMQIEFDDAEGSVGRPGAR
jgi:hypothetical protein